MSAYLGEELSGGRALGCADLRGGAKAFTLEGLRDFLADKLGRHELPVHFEFRGAPPETAVGKLSKKELVEEERQRAKVTAPQP